jgi:hypothetical protein
MGISLVVMGAIALAAVSFVVMGSSTTTAKSATMEILRRAMAVAHRVSPSSVVMESATTERIAMMGTTSAVMAAIVIVHPPGVATESKQLASNAMMEIAIPATAVPPPV